MKTFLILYIAVLAMVCHATTNVLELTWAPPPGFQSTLYESTSINGSWTSMGQVTPPVTVQPTNPVAFFYVSVAPTNQIMNFAAAGDPALDAPAGASYVNTNTGDWWLNVKGGTNGWVWEIAGP